MQVWQIATGEVGRDYNSLFFDHDIMLLGPSHYGHGIENAKKYWDGVPNSKGNQVHSFVHNPKQGDRVIMRLGKEILAVGEMSSEPYTFDSKFQCVFGWDLCHVRRVNWTRNLPDELRFVFKNAKQKPAFSQVHESHIKRLVKKINPDSFKKELKKLSSFSTKRYTNESLGKELFKKGISSRNIEDIIKALSNADRLLNWYWSQPKGRPTEHEVISHLILPIFLGLGWSHQQVAVEWNKVDMAFFKTTPTNANSCVAILEAKGLGMALEQVIKQPERYMKRLKLKGLRKIIVTDGADIFVYEVNSMVVNPNPVGYASINNLQKEYIIPKGMNLVDTLVQMQPATI
jgi:hypothetical protein